MDSKGCSVDVSIVIVCMNNVKDLFGCLDSVRKFTTINYEVFVVAYLFSKENLESLRELYPWVRVVESNEIRGFSENNNLALRQACGEYCFILNDDTYIDTPVIDNLFNTFTAEKRAAIISPVILDLDGTRTSGRPPSRLYSFVLYNLFRISYIARKDRKYIDQTGVFQTYNIAGSAFMIKTEVLRDLDYFDEKYFFCPEDIALSELANVRGYGCYVNADSVVHHCHANTFKKTSLAVYPAMQKGLLIFYSEGNRFRYLCLSILMIVSYLTMMGYWICVPGKKREVRSINIQRYRNAIHSLWSKKTPKEIFVGYYKS